MKIGEIWISIDEPLEDEFPEAILLESYDGEDLWTVEVGWLENDIFYSDDSGYRVGMKGEEIYQGYVLGSKAYV